MILLTRGVEASNLVVSATYMFYDQYGKAVLRMISFNAQNPEQYEQFEAARLAVPAEVSA